MSATYEDLKGDKMKNTLHTTTTNKVKKGEVIRKINHFVDGKKATPDEYEFAKACLSHGMEYKFQPETIILIEGFKGSLKNWKDSAYTPDFELTIEGVKVIIEIKGFMRADNSLKHKLADLYYSAEDTAYFVLKWKGKISDGTKGFYDYSNPNFKKMNNPIEYEFFHQLKQGK